MNIIKYENILNIFEQKRDLKNIFCQTEYFIKNGSQNPLRRVQKRASLNKGLPLQSSLKDQRPRVANIVKKSTFFDDPSRGKLTQTILLKFETKHL